MSTYDLYTGVGVPSMHMCVHIAETWLILSLPDMMSKVLMIQRRIRHVGQRIQDFTYKPNKFWGFKVCKALVSFLAPHMPPP